jgi:hypothetical protein
VLTGNELGKWIDARLTRSAYRLELLDRYDAASEREAFARFLRGEPSAAERRPWLARIRAESEAGILNQRVHVLSTPLTDYLRFEATWGYAYNAAAGEDIRIIDLSERPAPAGLPGHDYWLIDDAHALVMHYDDAGRLIGAEPASDAELPVYQRAREAAVAAAEPFAAWWARHREEYRAA